MQPQVRRFWSRSRGWRSGSGGYRSGRWSWSGWGSGHLRDGFAGLGDDGDEIADGNGDALLGDDASEDAAGVGFEFYGGLVGFDVGDDLAAVHRFALLLVPADDGAFPHIVSHLWHDDVGCHGVLLC